MNLCGLGNYAEPDLIELNISDDRFKGVASSSRRKSSHNRKRSDGDNSQHHGRSSPAQYGSSSRSSSKGRPSTKGGSSSKGRQSPSFLNPVDPPSRTSSKPPKKACVQSLEKGFNVVMITDESTRNVKLDLDPKNPHIRIRPLDGNMKENSRSFMETQFRLQDIARLEVGREKSDQKTSRSKKPVRLFSIMLRSRSKQYRSFNFEAESVPDRDAIIEAIKTLLEEARSLHARQKKQSKSSHSRSTIDVDLNPTKATEEKQSRSRHERRVVETRNDSYSTGSYSRGSSDDSSREKYPDDTLSAWTSSSGSKSSGARSRNSRSTGSSSKRMKDAAAIEQSSKGIGYNAFQSNSNAVVEDKELAAKFESHQNAPWCTDDICSAGFKEFNATVTGIFGETVSNGMKHRSMGHSTTTPQSMTSLLWSPRSSTRRKRRLQNRAANPSSKARRWKNLRYQMTFEGADLENDIPYIKTTRSCDDFDKSREKPMAEPQSNPFSTNRHNNGEGDVLYYDSDPEDARECTFKRVGPRGVQANMDNKIKDDSELGRKRYTASMTPLYNRRMKKVDDSLILDIIENMKNQKLTLMWHPEQTEDGPNQAPVCVKVWIESGIYLVDGTFLLPKLTWLPVHERNTRSFLTNASIQNPEALDMLDVCRVRECDFIDRKLYPYADVNRSFIIQTQGGMTLFETRSRHERSHMVNGLKLVIARLASLLMLRDLRAVDEFFGGNSVPGEAPWWAKGTQEESESGGMPAMP